MKRVSLAIVLLAATAVSAGSCDKTIMPTSADSGCHINALPCLTDGGPLTVYVNGLGSHMRTATIATLNGSYNTTDVAPVSYLDHHKDSGNGETDVVYLYQNLDLGVYGQTSCNDSSIGNDKCDQTYVAYAGNGQLNWFLDNPNHADLYRALACHETGHSVGLLHGEWSDDDDGHGHVPNDATELYCMITPGLDHPYTVGQLNTAWINAIY